MGGYITYPPDFSAVPHSPYHVNPPSKGMFLANDISLVFKPIRYLYRRYIHDLALAFYPRFGLSHLAKQPFLWLADPDSGPNPEFRPSRCWQPACSNNLTSAHFAYSCFPQFPVPYSHFQGFLPKW